MRLAKAIHTCLEAHGVDTVFGIPGNHNIELYRELDKSRLRHITARHEQGAAFMADGYARTTARPGVCFLISGPGLTNAATALAQSMADSVPVVVIVTVGEQAAREGRLHELPDQLAVAQGVCLEALQPASPRAVVDALEQALIRHVDHRPGPRCVQIPISWLKRDIALPQFRRAARAVPRCDITQALEVLAAAHRPVIILGGGAQGAAEEVAALAAILAAPVLNTVNAKGILPPGHALWVGGSLSLEAARSVLRDADMLLVVGSELGETDLDLTMLGNVDFTGKPVIRIDIDPAQVQLNLVPQVGLVGDSAYLLRQFIKAELPQRKPWLNVAQVRATMRAHRHYHPEFARLFELVDRACPGAVIVGDSTRPTYYASWMWERARPRTYFHSVSGYGTLGYALPAAIGAQIASPGVQVVGIVGDGGLLFSVGELAVAAIERLPLKLIVWNNQGYQEIANSMTAAGIDARATQFPAPDLLQLGRSLGAVVDAPQDWSALDEALRKDNSSPQVIVLDESDFITTPVGGWYA